MAAAVKTHMSHEVTRARLTRRMPPAVQKAHVLGQADQAGDVMLSRRMKCAMVHKIGQGEELQPLRERT